MTLRLSLYLAIVSALSSAGASAQIAGSRLNKVAAKEDASKIMADFVGCIAGVEAKWSRALLETLPGSAAEQAMVKEINGDRFSRCLIGDRFNMDNRSLGMSDKALRGALAAYYVRTAYRGRTASDVTSGGASGWMTAKLAARSPGETLNRPLLIAHDFAACVVDTDWNRARLFIETVPATAGERASLKGLAARFPACLQQGAKMRFDAAILRVTLSEALYHSLNGEARIGVENRASLN